jgi:serine/threonine protein phosphatase PrpC
LPVRSLAARHNAANPDEVNRVMASGGHFRDNRLLGCLLPTRAFGNIDCLRFAPGVLSARPQFQVVRLRPLAGGDAAALVLATDGLWDIMETPAVVSTLKAGLKRQARQLATVNIAETLVVDAIRGGSDDDTSAVVLVLK